MQAVDAAEAIAMAIITRRRITRPFDIGIAAERRRYYCWR